jgi:hypothetical protein
MARFLFAYDCHLVNCVRHTRSTARQRYVSDTTQEDQGRLTPRRAALAAALACLPVLVAAVNIVSHEHRLEGWIKAHAQCSFAVPGLLPVCAEPPRLLMRLSSVGRRRYRRERTLGGWLGTHFVDVVVLSVSIEFARLKFERKSASWWWKVENTNRANHALVPESASPLNKCIHPYHNQPSAM